MNELAKLSRRRWLQGLGLGALAELAPGVTAAEPAPLLPPLQAGVPVAIDERYWTAVAAQYRVAPDLVNLENGFYGIMARPVLAQYQRNVAWLNEHNSAYLRQQYAADANAARARIAAALGVLPDEIALTRGATESLQILIANYRGLKAGDTVMYADLDYDSAQQEFDLLRARHGVDVARIVLPEPASRQGIIDAYARALAAHPRTRLLLLTHLNNKTGLLLPLADIVRLARERGVDTIVDAAHSFGQVDVPFHSLGVDFAAFNLHKWIGAPLGVGFLYIRKARLRAIAPHLPGEGEDDIAARVHTGTTNTANVMTIAAALDFHERIGGANKAARLRYLRDYWVGRVRDLPGLQVLTPDEEGMTGAITAFRLRGQTSKAANQAVAARLLKDYGIFTVQRGGVAGGDCVRVTPALFTRTADLDRLVAALREIAA
jgi:selenocysteine lyase/cysteine desulfurase